jgi:hypothetical protein
MGQGNNVSSKLSEEDEQKLNEKMAEMEARFKKMTENV